MTFERKTVNMAIDVSEKVRLAAYVDHRVSESLLMETAARLFLALSPDEQKAAIGNFRDSRRRKSTPTETAA